MTIFLNSHLFYFCKPIRKEGRFSYPAMRKFHPTVFQHRKGENAASVLPFSIRGHAPAKQTHIRRISSYLRFLSAFLAFFFEAFVSFFFTSF